MIAGVTRSDRPSPLTSATTVWTEKGRWRSLLIQKRTAAVVEQDAHAIATVVGGDDVGFAVAVQIGHRHGIRAGSRPRRFAAAGMCRRQCPCSTLTLLLAALAVMMSGMPSPLSQPRPPRMAADRWRRRSLRREINVARWFRPDS